MSSTWYKYFNAEFTKDNGKFDTGYPWPVFGYMDFWASNMPINDADTSSTLACPTSLAKISGIRSRGISFISCRCRKQPFLVIVKFFPLFLEERELDEAEMEAVRHQFV